MPSSAAEATGFLDRVYTDSAGNEHKYVLFVPERYHEKPRPLILFLHGIGERGTDGRKQTAVGLGPAIQKQRHTFPFITVFPQARLGYWTAEIDDSQMALAILDDVEKTYRVDTKRVYLTGISLGGHGVWCLAQKDPGRWAAIVPVCGWGNPDHAERIKDIPCWCFHGARDTTVRAVTSENMIEALRSVGGSPRYTEYPDVGHGSWVRAYATPELYDWLLAQRLK
jgi:predicted peptidase